MRKKNVSLIINPRTGENTAKLQEILAVFSAAGWKTDIELKEYGKHVMKLAHQAAAHKQDLVVAYGGDGTLNQVVNGVMSANGKGKLQSAVGLIPGGTANVWAGEIGVPTDPVKAALTLVNSEPRKVDVGRIAICAIEFPGEESATHDKSAEGTKSVESVTGAQDEQSSEHTVASSDADALAQDGVASKERIQSAVAVKDVDDEKDALRAKNTRKFKLSKVGKQATRESDSVRHHFLLMAGIGLDAAVMRGVSKPLKYNIGALAVGASIVKELPAHHPFSLQIFSGEHGHDVLWQGEAQQLIIGNSRRYARVEKITPDAYINDGKLDLCVITSGNPLNTVQQVTSLLLRQKPDNATAEYFRGAHMRIRVPATIPFQVDGSDVNLKDYLSSSDYERLSRLSIEEQKDIFVTYLLDTLPEALSVAVPLTYDNELFKYSAEQESQQEGQTGHDASEQHSDDEHGQQKDEHVVEPPTHIEAGRQHRGFLFGKRAHNNESAGDSEHQRQTLAVESLPSSDMQTSDMQNGHAAERPKLHASEGQETDAATANAKRLLKSKGRYVTVVGKVADPEHSHTYIIAGTMHKASTGESLPTAVVVDNSTSIINAEGQEFAHAVSSLQELAEGDVIVVDGKRSKRNVLHARKIVLV